MSVPNSREVQEFQFKLLTRLRVFSGISQLQFDGSLNLVAAASRYGLIFVGNPSGFSVIKVADIVELQANVKRKPSEFCDYTSRRINLGTQPSHLDVSCDCQLLAVSFVLNGAPQVCVYSVASFTSQEVTVIREVPCENRVTCMSWNPAVPGMLAVCLANGVAVVYEFSNVSISINTASDANAVCLCWSPKGRQVVIGSSTGTLSQYKPDLKLFKTFPQPNYCTNPMSVISVQWLSNFQFLAVYKDTVDSNKRPGVVIVNAPKAGPVTYLNYDDICYSSGTLRDPQFYIIHQQIWNIIMVASANSMEVGVLGLENDSWVQWIQEDAARADLPLSSSKQETYVVGMTFDTSVQYNLPYGENQTLPPMPLLILLSHEGLLCLFFAVNILPSSTVICSPPEPLSDMSGVQFFVPYSQAEIIKDVKYGSTVPVGQNPVIKPVVTSQPPMWSTPPLAVQTNQQNVWTTIPQSTIPSWMAPVNTFLSQPQPSTMQAVFQKSENKKPSASQGSPAVMWTNSAAFIQPNIIQQQQQQPVTSAGQDLITGGSMGRKEVSGILSPQITLNIKPQPSPKLLTNQAETKVSEILEHEAVEDAEDTISSISDGVIETTLVDVVNHFNSDLTDITENIGNTNCYIGTREEKLKLQQSFDNLESFLTELSETTTAQKFEIKSLNNSLFDLFAWIEDARSRAQQLSEQSYTMSTELDPVSTRKMNSIEHLLFYTSSQISHINSQLNDCWEDIQDKQREKMSFQLRTPWMESVFQALSLQNNLINKYSLLLDEIDKKVDECKNITQFPLISKLSFASDDYSGDIELSKLAESFLGIKLAKIGKSPKSEQIPMNGHTKNMKINKIQKVQELLCNHPISKVQHPKSFTTTKVYNHNKEPMSGLSLPVTGAKLGGISSGQPIVAKEVNVLYDSKSLFAITKASDVNKTLQSSYKTVFDVAQPSKGYSDIVSKTKVAQTYQNISQFDAAIIQDCSNITSVEEKTTDNILEAGFQRNVINPEVNEYMQPAVLVQNSPLASLNNIVASIPDTQHTMPESNISYTNDSKSVLSSDTPKMKDKVSGISASKLAFGKETDRAKSDSSLLTGSPKISFGSVNDKRVEDSSSKLNFSISNTSQNFFKSTSTSPEMSKNFFGNSASPFKSVFAGSPVISEVPGLTVSKTNTDVKAPKGVLGTSPSAKNVFGFLDFKQTVTTEPVSSDGNMGIAKNIFSTKTVVDVPKTVLPQSTAVSGENSKSVFSTAGSTGKDILSTPTEFNAGVPDQITVKHAGNEWAVRSPFVSELVVESPKLIFGSSSTGNSTLLNAENLETNKTVFSEATSVPKTVCLTTVTSPNGDFIVPQNTHANYTKTDNKYVSSVTSPISSSSIQEVENIEEKSIIKDTTESKERNEDEQNTPVQNTSLPLFDSLSLEQTSPTKTGNLSAELLDDSELENKTNMESPNILPVKTTSGSVPSATSSFSSLLSMQNTSLSSSNNSPSAETVSLSPVSKAETKAVSGTGDIFSKPVSPVALAVAEKVLTTQAADTFSFSLPATTAGVTQASFTFSLPAASPDKSVSSTFRFPQPNTTVTSTTTSSSTFSFGQLASAVTTTATDKNAKITLSFGNPQTTVSTSTPIFSGFTTPQPSLFGQPTTTSTTNTAPETCFSFTIPTTASPQNSFFGNKTNLFPTPTTTATTTTTTTTTSIFGQPLSSPASTANSPFSQTTSVFGQATSPGSPFGSSPAFNTKPTFGQSGGSLFGQNSSSGFNSSGTSIFGGSSMFGASGTTSGTLFQNSGTSSIFGGANTSPGGSFSSGGQTISQAGFGSPNAFQNKPAGTFGGAPTFGSAPSFGGAPTFGGSPTFGSPNKVFGSTVPSTGFGSTQQSTTFENLANQNTMTFGNLAQASSGSAFGGSMFAGNAPQSQAPTTFPSGSTSFGGSSFSSWR